MKRILLTICFSVWISIPESRATDVVILEDGEPKVEIVVDVRESVGSGPAILQDAATWLAQSLKQASGGEFLITENAKAQHAIIIARADAWPDVARTVKLGTQSYDGYAIVTKPDEQRIFILGNTEAAARHGVAHLLRKWGFRWFAPSPKWHVTPKFRDLALNLTTTESPRLIERRVWYAYGMSGDDLKPLMRDYERWAVANRLTLRGPVQCGHSYGNIILRNKEAFAEDPELSAQLADGTRDTKRHPNARKLCFSNSDLAQLVIEDRRKLLETNRKANPASFMVSVDPSDGEGTCHCEECAKLGTTTDRVFHLANEVAKGLRKTDPEAWVGLYAYSSHRLPPTINVEPNVYVQVAMGFNRTEYSLPELVDRWSKKVEAIGLREYYGVEAWDWGLPGRARGGRVGYHRKWIPFYADRNLNGINAETNANWGAQALGLYVASQLMWDPKADVEAITDEFFSMLFGDAAKPMRDFYTRMEAAPALRPSLLLPLCANLQSAWEATEDPSIRARVTDLMAYLVYVAKFREFDLVQSRNSERNDAYYDSLKSLMNYAWRIRHRDMVHYYALARRLCNALPLSDNRPEYSLRYTEGDPVWRNGTAPSDAEIVSQFRETVAALKADGDPTVAFSRYLDQVTVPGDDAGASHIHAKPQEKIAVSRFRGGLRGYLVPSGPLTAKFGISPTSRPITLTVTMRDEVIFEKQYHAAEAFQDVEIELPRAFEYHVEITGDFELRVPSETPFVFEASATRPAWISYSGPHYFYVPKGTTELIVDASPRLSLIIPGEGRRDLVPADRVDGKSYMLVKVPEGANGKVWHTATLTRGQVTLLNVPPLMGFHRETVLVPREVSESEGLTTDQP